MYDGAADLPLIGGHPALDLVNTVEPRVPVPAAEPHDHLGDPPALLLWTHRAGLVDEADAKAMASTWDGDAGAAQAALHAVQEVRDALHVVLLSVTGGTPGDVQEIGVALERLHSRWAAAVSRSRLVLDATDTAMPRLVFGMVPALLVPDRVADAALDLLRSADLARLGRCPPEAGGCGWMYLDRSRNRSRRWCRMADCGTEAKARRLTERRRAARTAPRGRRSSPGHRSGSLERE